MLFAGKFNDSRMEKHDIKFRGVVDKHGKELEDMAGYYSEVEDMVRVERARGEAAGKAIGEATGKAIGIIEMAVDGRDIIGTNQRKPSKIKGLQMI